ncbi:MAG: ribosome maturation factor RimM [Mycoplasmatales bacterium]
MIEIGKIVNTQGIKGEVRIMSNSDFKDIRFAKGAKILVKTAKGELVLTVENHFFHKSFDIVKFIEYSNINEVLFLKNNLIYGEKLEVEENNALILDLLKMKVYNQDGIYRGLVKEVLDYGHYNVMRVESEKTSKIIPCTDFFITKIDEATRTITINEVSGMFDED